MRFVQLRSQSAAVSRLWNSLSAVSQQLKGLIAENKTQLRPALDKLNGVVTMLDNRKERLQEAVKRLSQYAMWHWVMRSVRARSSRRTS